jgi:hypothetical protein
MAELFPFGFSAATGAYLSLYVLTLALHVVLMNYVIAGSAVVALATLRRRSAGPSPIADTVRDWLPFSLGAAITAGVAPLLFVQVLYERQFYSANLLLSHRWMAILPVLIAGFYLVYLQKTGWIRQRPAWLRVAVAAGAFACFAFTGYSWTENHLLSIHERDWSRFYASGALLYYRPELIPRLLFAFAAAFPTLSAVVGWQLRRRADAPTTRRLALLAALGLFAAAGAGVLYGETLEAPTRAQVRSPLAFPYLVLAMAGAAAQLAAWVVQWRSQRLRAGWLGVASAGAFLSIVGIAVVREALRLGSLDLAALSAEHARAADAGGAMVFAVALGLNFLLIAYTVFLARRCRAGVVHE